MENKTIINEIMDARFIYYCYLQDIVNFLEGKELINERGAFDLNKLALNDIDELTDLIKLSKNAKNHIIELENRLEEMDAELKELLKDY